MKEASTRGATVPLPQAMQRALTAYGRGAWAESEHWCRQILAVRADYLDALNLLGIIAAQTRRPEEAARLLGRVVEANPGEAVAHNNYGNVLQELRRYDAALQSYERALKIKPDYTDALNNRGNALLQLQRFEEALESYERALALRPDCAEALNYRGNALQGLKQPEAALASYERALALKPDYAEALNNRGNALQQLQRLDEALAAYDRALALKPDYAEVLNNRGNALHKLKRFDAALAAYERALALKPDYAEALCNRGNTLQELQRLDEALAAYERALALNPALGGVVRALESLGALLSRLGRTGQAAAVYRRWLQLEPANPIAQHLYAATSGDEVPPRASARYVSAWFDGFADSFDSALQRVDYAAPRLLHEALAEKAACGLDILDAGCGTGLCGVLMRSRAKSLVGVDLSAQMLARARARNLYDELCEGELCAFMAARPAQFDLVVCTDTLVYFGALDEAVAAAHRCLRPKGLFAFTVEALPGEDAAPFRIHAHGRYAHGDGYLRATMQSAGFGEVQCSPIVVRKEFGADVRGYLVIGCAST